MDQRRGGRRVRDQSVRAGVVTPKQLSSWCRWAIVLIGVVAAVITPSSDPFSMMALAVPLYVFSELSIVAGRIVARSRDRQAA